MKSSGCSKVDSLITVVLISSSKTITENSSVRYVYKLKPLIKFVRGVVSACPYCGVVTPNRMMTRAGQSCPGVNCNPSVGIYVAIGSASAASLNQINLSRIFSYPNWSGIIIRKLYILASSIKEKRPTSLYSGISRRVYEGSVHSVASQI